MVIRVINRNLVQQDQYLVWNSYVEILAMSNYDDLDQIQKPAHLIFWYESEVQNGGHFQYFENNYEKNYRIPETIISLNLLGAISQSKTLESAFKQFKSKERKKIETVEEFCENAQEVEFEIFDKEFYEAEPNLIEILEKYLKENMASFIKINE